ncbi:hypothetical protein BD310DRAFT_697043 [Dichomitus squalens]|uniref:Fungal-type protein kinase domain-containing protein n=1 Tax=Dichomitus squalens TaxID=114155 RepID=A0A4V2K959_9APHY|nr:hypothetical protein BD310DRAFT_697043 [Dichomitus squalens]
MSRWRQLQMDNWMAMFAPPGDKLSEKISTRLRQLTEETYKENKVTSLSNIKIEADLYTPFFGLIKAILTEFESKDLVSLNTSVHKDDNDKKTTIPDGGIYLASDQARRATKLLPARVKKGKTQPEPAEERPDPGPEERPDPDPEERPDPGPEERPDPKPKEGSLDNVARRSWHWVNTIIEGKGSPDRCAFHFSKHGETFLRSSKEGKAALGQLAEYMTHVFKYQHRTFAYAIYFFRNKARLIYFDRTGAAVSDWCDFETDLYLQEFVYRLAKAGDAERGYDPTATLMPPDSPEVQEFLAWDNAKLPLFRQWVQQATERSCPIYKLEVTSEMRDASGEVHTARRYFLVGRPHACGEALVGRCTRGYIAFNLAEKTLCFLKDSWRAVVPGRTRPEHEVYQRLHARLNASGCSTDGLPTLLCGGDVGGHEAQKTRVHSEITQAQPVPRAHHRLVLCEVGLPLEKFGDFHSLVQLVRQAVDTHADAWKHAGVLHRDISVSNILIRYDMKKGRAVGSMLCDWDLSKYKEELALEPTQPDRTGTWAFKSALSLLFPWKRYELSDDVESFVHVLHYLILRYHRTSLRKELKAFVDSYFSDYDEHHGIHYGGDKKWRLFDHDAVVTPYRVVSNEPLQSLVDGLAVLCHNQYQLKRPFVEEMTAEYEHPFLAGPDPVSPSAGGGVSLDYVGRYEELKKPVFPSPARPVLPSSPPPSLTLEDHTGLIVLLGNVHDLNWKGSGQYMDQFDFEHPNGKTSRFRSNFSTSEHLDLAPSGPSSASKRVRKGVRGTTGAAGKQRKRRKGGDARNDDNSSERGEGNSGASGSGEDE